MVNRDEYKDKIKTLSKKDLYEEAQKQIKKAKSDSHKIVLKMEECKHA